ncbi:FAD synthetase family protein [Magnetovibrio sp.]|uniref:FAD synthetase family protein n=1 Tax=Magnetovibrio sp. TaxID=2024836 RepID=UPI002F958141
MIARVHKSLTNLPSDAKGCVVAIGNFDGVHQGHQALICRARDKAMELGAPVGVLTFEPHPRAFFDPNQAPFRLTAENLKTAYMASQGVDHIFVAEFNAAFAALSAQSFVDEVLVRDLAVAHVVVGADYRFGSRRHGDIALLRALGKAGGFGVSEVAPVMDRHGLVYSSTRARAALRDGMPNLAREIMSRTWELHGRAEHFEDGVVSIAFDGHQRPLPGMYVVRVDISDPHTGKVVETVQTLAWHYAARFDGENELYISFDTDAIVGKRLRVQFLDYVEAGRLDYVGTNWAYPTEKPDLPVLDTGWL